MSTRQKPDDFFKIKTFLKVLFLSVVVTMAIITLNQGCRNENDYRGDIDTLPRFTRHCWAPTWSPDGQTIAFGYVPWIKVEGDTFIEKWDSSGIFFIDADGKNKRPFLVAGIAPFLCFPDFSGDGKWLVFVGGPGGVNNIHKAKIDGDSITQLTFNNYMNASPSWSPDGKKILFGRTYAPEDSCGLCLMDADGSNNRVINHEPAATRGIFLPDFRIVFCGWVGTSNGLWITDTLGANKKRIYEYGGHSEGLSCSPDGSKILFEEFNEEKKRYEIWLINIDGTGVKRLCVDGIHPAWSPDGKKVVYVKYNWTNQAMIHPGYGELWIMDADGSNQRQLTYPD